MRKGNSRILPSILKKWLPYLRTLLIIIFAAIPPLFVFTQRWINDQSSVEKINYGYGVCPIQLFCQSSLSSVSLILIILCSICLLVLIMQSKAGIGGLIQLDTFENARRACIDEKNELQSLISRFCILASGLLFVLLVILNILLKRIPGLDLILVTTIYLAGWILKEYHASWFNRIITRRFIGVALTTIILLLLANMFSILFHKSNNYLPTVILLIAASAIMLRFFPKWRAILIILCLGLALFSINLDAWQTSFIGDEYAYFDLAHTIVEDQDLTSVGGGLFEANGVYGKFPMLATYIQSFFMKLFGSDGFGWRMSNVLLCTAGIGLLYMFFTTFLENRLALSAATLLACSEYLMSFVKIGYINLQVFFILALEMALSTWVIRSKRFLAFVLLGFSIGISFYLFPAALYTVPIPVFLLLLYYPPITKEAAPRWMVMLVSTGMIVFPLFMQPEYWSTRLPGTFLGNPDIISSAGRLIDHLISNSFNAIYSFLFIQQDTHFVSVSYTDPLTSLFILIGLVLALVGFRKSRFTAFCMLSFILMLFLAGVSHGYPLPPTTRMFLLLPWWVIFAALGLGYVLDQLHILFKISSLIQTSVLIGILILAIIINTYQAIPLSYAHFADNQSPESLLIKAARDAEEDNPGSTKYFIFLTDTKETVEGFLRFQVVYPQYFHSTVIQERVLVDSTILEMDLPSLANPDSFIFLSNPSNPDWIDFNEGILIGMGKTPCYFNSYGKSNLLFLYSHSDYPNACR